MSTIASKCEEDDEMHAKSSMPSLARHCASYFQIMRCQETTAGSMSTTCVREHTTGLTSVVSSPSPSQVGVLTPIAAITLNTKLVIAAMSASTVSALVQSARYWHHGSCAATVGMVLLAPAAADRRHHCKRLLVR